jgi:hypothetical protein
MSEPRFREVQRFRQPWVWCLILATCGWLTGVVLYGVVQQLGSGEPWGDQPMPDVWLLITALGTVSFSLGMVWLFWAMELQVEVRSDALYLHFRPLKRRTIQYQEIASVEACEYRPVLQYGGWGIRRGRNGWAYNVSGNQGVRLSLTDGGELLIGSQRSTELAVAIAAERAR